MKHLIMALTVLLAVPAVETHAQKLRIGLDVGSLIRIETVRLDAEYGFSRNWSAGGEAVIDIRTLKRKVNEEEEAHRTELDGREVTDGHMRTRHEAGIFFQYWPDAKFTGPSICIGGCIKEGYKADMLIGIGYSCRITKGFGIGISLKTRLLESMKTQSIENESLQIKLHYDF